MSVKFHWLLFWKQCLLWSHFREGQVENFYFDWEQSLTHQCGLQEQQEVLFCVFVGSEHFLVLGFRPQDLMYWHQKYIFNCMILFAILRGAEKWVKEANVVTKGNVQPSTSSGLYFSGCGNPFLHWIWVGPHPAICTERREYSALHYTCYRSTVDVDELHLTWSSAHTNSQLAAFSPLRCVCGGKSDGVTQVPKHQSSECPQWKTH